MTFRICNQKIVFNFVVVAEMLCHSAILLILFSFESNYTMDMSDAQNDCVLCVVVLMCRFTGINENFFYLIINSFALGFA